MIPISQLLPVFNCHLARRDVDLIVRLEDELIEASICCIILEVGRAQGSVFTPLRMLLHIVGEKGKRKTTLPAAIRIFNTQITFEYFAVVNWKITRFVLDLITGDKLFEFINFGAIGERTHSPLGDEQVLREGRVRSVQVDRRSSVVEMHDGHGSHVNE